MLASALAVRLAARSRGAGLVLPNARGLACKRAKVVQLRATHATATDDDQVADHRAVHREDALDSNSIRDLAHGKRLVDAGAATGDAHALERLEPLLVTLLHADVHAQGVTGAERRDVRAEPFFLGFDEGDRKSTRLNSSH